MRTPLLVAVLTMTSCISHPIANADQCHAKGGTLERIGTDPTPLCVLPFDDAGKPCSDKADWLAYASLKRRQ